MDEPLIEPLSVSDEIDALRELLGITSFTRSGLVARVGSMRRVGWGYGQIYRAMVAGGVPEAEVRGAMVDELCDQMRAGLAEGAAEGLPRPVLEAHVREVVRRTSTVDVGSLVSDVELGAALEVAARQQLDEMFLS